MDNNKRKEIIKALKLAKKHVVTSKEEAELGVFSAYDYFICVTGAIKASAAAKEYLMAQKPTEYINTEFTKHPQYVGEYSWWKRPEEDVDDRYNDVALRDEKRRFIQHLIDKLKKERDENR